MVNKPVKSHCKHTTTLENGNVELTSDGSVIVVGSCRKQMLSFCISSTGQIIMRSKGDSLVLKKHEQPTLSDLTPERFTSIFYSYAHELKFSRTFRDEEAIMVLSRKLCVSFTMRKEKQVIGGTIFGETAENDMISICVMSNPAETHSSTQRLLKIAMLS